MTDSETVCIPGSALTLRGFRAWAVSDSFPERGQISFIGEHIFLDFSREELQTHNRVRTGIYPVIGQLVRERDNGTLYTYGVLFSNERANVSHQPDAMFISWDNFRSRRSELVPLDGFPGQYMELLGAPDWILEVVSESSVVKDAQQLRQAYHRAGISEYWLVNALGKQIDFQILHHRRSGFVATPNRAGWRRSRVFSADFRLTRRRNRLNLWDYTLAVREA